MDNPFTEDELSYLLQFPKSVATNASVPYSGSDHHQFRIRDNLNSKNK